MNPYNFPVLEAVEAMAGTVAPSDIRDNIFGADINDDLSGLRLIAAQMHEHNYWQDEIGIKQPKKQIADHVERFGFRVPKRYDSFGEALEDVEAGKTIIVRSEHPQEYADFSGLLYSPPINKYELENRKPANAYAPTPLAMMLRQGKDPDKALELWSWTELDERMPSRWMQLTGQGKDDFFFDLSYSFWERVPGQNVMVTGDDTIDGRYHIVTRIMDGQEERGCWITNEAGTSEQGFDGHLNGTITEEQRAKLIEIYENIAMLPGFDVRNRPLMEFQVDQQGEIWFLQYHKGRKFRAYNDHLDPNDYPEVEGWQKVEAVRGALGSFVTLKTALWYPEPMSIAPDREYTPRGLEQASFDMHYDLGLTEFLSPRRTAYIGWRGFEDTYMGMGDGKHEVRSRWFKPVAALALAREDFEKVIPNDLKKKVSENVHRKGYVARVALDMASDGRQGFMRLNPDVEQPFLYNADSE